MRERKEGRDARAFSAAERRDAGVDDAVHDDVDDGESGKAYRSLILGSA